MEDCDGSCKSEGVIQAPALTQITNLEGEALASSAFNRNTTFGHKETYDYPMCQNSITEQQSITVVIAESVIT